MIYLGGLKRVKDTLILGLRSFYANPQNYMNLLPPQLTPEAFHNISVYDGSPQTLKTFPMIVVAGSSGRMIAGGISNDFASEIYDQYGDTEGYLYGGMYEFSLEVEIGTRTTLEREVLMDITTSAIRWSLRRKMEYHGITVKDVSYGGENKLQYDSDFIYTSMINVQTYSEWYEYYKLLPITDVQVQGEYQSTKSSSSYMPKETEDESNVNQRIYDMSKNK